MCKMSDKTGDLKAEFKKSWATNAYAFKGGKLVHKQMGSLVINALLYPRSRFQIGIEPLPKSISDFIPNLHNDHTMDLFSGRNFLPTLLMFEKGASYVVQAEQSENSYMWNLFSLYILGLFLDILGKGKWLGELENFTESVKRIKYAFKRTDHGENYDKALEGVFNMVKGRMSTLYSDGVEGVPYVATRDGKIATNDENKKLYATLLDFANNLHVSRCYSPLKTTPVARKPESKNDIVVPIYRPWRTIEQILPKLEHVGIKYIFSNMALEWLLNRKEAGSYPDNNFDTFIDSLKQAIDSGIAMTLIDTKKHILKLGGALAGNPISKAQDLKGGVSGYNLRYRDYVDKNPYDFKEMNRAILFIEKKD